MTDEHAFESGASSSERMVMYHLVPPGFIRRVAERFTLGAVKHGDVNYQMALRHINEHTIEVDVQFLRDRYNHALNHLLNVKRQPDWQDDNLAAVGWFTAIAIWFEEAGVNWHRILNPQGGGERLLRFSDGLAV